MLPREIKDKAKDEALMGWGVGSLSVFGLAQALDPTSKNNCLSPDALNPYIVLAILGGVSITVAGMLIKCCYYPRVLKKHRAEWEKELRTNQKIDEGNKLITELTQLVASQNAEKTGAESKDEEAVKKNKIKIIERAQAYLINKRPKAKKKTIKSQDAKKIPAENKPHKPDIVINVKPSASAETPKELSVVVDKKDELDLLDLKLQQEKLELDKEEAGAKADLRQGQLKLEAAKIKQAKSNVRKKINEINGKLKVKLQEIAKEKKQLAALITDLKKLIEDANKCVAEAEGLVAPAQNDRKEDKGHSSQPSLSTFTLFNAGNAKIQPAPSLNAALSNASSGTSLPAVSEPASPSEDKKPSPSNKEQKPAPKTEGLKAPAKGIGKFASTASATPRRASESPNQPQPKASANNRRVTVAGAPKR